MTSNDKQAAKGGNAQRVSSDNVCGKTKTTQRQDGGTKGAHSGGTKRQQRQPDGKSAVVLSAAVFVLCMACLATGFYLSSPATQNDGSTDVWQPPVDQVTSPQSAQKNQLPTVEQTPTDSTPSPPAITVLAVEVAREDSFVPQLQSSAPIRSASVDEVAVEVQPNVQTINSDQTANLARSGTASVKPSQNTRVESETSLSVVKQVGGDDFGIPPAQNGAVLVFIIDDGGYSTVHLEEYTNLPFPVAVAVLPRLPHSAQCAQIVRSSGQELMLHQPMQAKNLSVYPGEGAVLPSMSAAEVYNTVVQNLREIAPVRGMNNHEGSLITSDKDKVTAILEATKDAGVYFLDSRTSADTVAPQVAAEKGMRILQRDIFIDDVISEDEMLKQILRGLDIANKNGQAVMIGHVDKSATILPSLLKRMYPELVRQGYVFSFPSELLR